MPFVQITLFSEENGSHHVARVKKKMLNWTTMAPSDVHMITQLIKANLINLHMLTSTEICHPKKVASGRW